MKKTVKTDTSLKKLKSDIASSALRQIYVLHGEEDYLRRHYLSKMKQALIAPGFEAFNYISYDVSELTPDKLIDAVETLPAMSDRKMVVITDFDVSKPPAAYQPAVERILGEPQDHCCLVFVYCTIEYKPDARTAAYKRLTAAAEIVEFAAQDATELRPWISRRFAEYGRSISHDTSDYLLFKCGHLMTRLSSEIDKLAAVSKHSEITRETIDLVVIPVIDAVIFDLTDAVSERKPGKATAILRDLLEMREQPTSILAAICRQLRQVYSARLAYEEGRDERLIMDLWALRSSYPAARLIKTARRLTLEWCRNSVILCARCDLALKSTGSDSQRELEILLAELCDETKSA